MGKALCESTGCKMGGLESMAGDRSEHMTGWVDMDFGMERLALYLYHVTTWHLWIGRLERRRFG